MVYQSGGWHPVPQTSIATAFYTAGSIEQGYKPNQLHEDWVAFHCKTTAHEIKEMAQLARTIPAYNSTNQKTLDVLAYSGYAGLGLGVPSSKSYFGDLRQKYGVDWEVLVAAGLTVAVTGYGQPNISNTKRLLLAGSTAQGRGDTAVPPLVCGAISGTQAGFAERYYTCDGAMEYDGPGARPFDSGLDFHVPRSISDDLH